MPDDNVKVVRRGVEAFVQGDWEACSADFHPQIEWVEMPSLGPDAATYAGVEQVRGAVESWVEMWRTYDFEVTRYESARDRVVVLARERVSSAGSQARVHRELGEVITLSEGKVVSVHLYGSWDEALGAAGLR